MKHTAWIACAQSALGLVKKQLQIVQQLLNPHALLCVVHVWRLCQTQPRNECRRIYQARVLQLSQQVTQHKPAPRHLSFRSPSFVLNHAAPRLNLRGG